MPADRGDHERSGTRLGFALFWVYVALYFAGLYGEAAAAEWAAFMTHAVLLLSFFSANDPEPKEEGKAKGQRGEREREWLLKPQG